ncbi:MAG: HD-GYP domain-containing protein [Spirochaetales bacterium]|nr:HD-GYP domain-containing protein [Spirochaetales bacterium]MCF7937434.1 HD-GYP domain-containing protein [Spirochaetales bacterium]
MKAYKIEDLKAGMKFSQPVYVDEQNLLVPERIALKEKDIKRLEKWGLENVYSDGEPIEENEEEESSLVSEVDEALEKNAVYRAYRKVVNSVDEIFQALPQGEGSSEAIDNQVNEILKLAHDFRDDLIQIILLYREAEQKYARTGVNTAILSLVTAQQLKIPHHRILQLVTGALLHDVGMYRVPEKVLNKKDKLNQEELKQIHTHPVYSYKTITDQLGYQNEIGMVALQHHERWDGTGYPRKLSGRSILDLARIVSIADAFEAMNSSRPYRDPMIGYNAMKSLLGDNGRRFDPDILKVFIKSMGIYPIGSMVLINDGNIGRVVGIHPGAPLRPKLELLLDEFGREYPKEERPIVDLQKEKKRFITKPIDPKSFSGE